MSSYAGKVVLITGASSGMGAELARQLAPQRPTLILLARDREKLEQVAAECQALGAAASVEVADVTDEARCRAVVAATVERHGGIDALVLNAGLGMWARVEEITDVSVFERIMRVNYLGSVYLTCAALPTLRARRGQIVVMSSLTGKVGVPTRSGYAASKHALHGFFDSLRIELMGSGVAITMVCPGFVSTEWRRRNLGASGAAKDMSHVREEQAMRPEVAVATMLRAMTRRDREVVYTWRGKIGQWIRLIAPSLTDRMAARAIKTGV